MSQLLAIDIGNTTTGVVFFKDISKETITWKTGIFTEELRSNQLNMPNALNPLTSIIDIDRVSVIAASVVPDLRDNLSRVIRGLTNRTVNLLEEFVSKDTAIISLPKRHKTIIGQDRIAALAGAYSIYKKAVAVIDFGTATTLSVVDSKGVFRGGAIMPGLNMMLQNLNEKTSMLPRVSIKKQGYASGIDTSSAILSGVLFGTAGAVERILVEIEKENHFRLQLVLTGGCSRWMKHYMRRSCEVKPFIIFEGLRQIYLRQSR